MTKPRFPHARMSKYCNLELETCSACFYLGQFDTASYLGDLYVTHYPCPRVYVRCGHDAFYTASHKIVDLVILMMSRARQRRPLVETHQQLYEAFKRAVALGYIDHVYAK